MYMKPNISYIRNFWWCIENEKHWGKGKTPQEAYNDYLKWEGLQL